MQLFSLNTWFARFTDPIRGVTDIRRMTGGYPPSGWRFLEAAYKWNCSEKRVYLPSIQRFFAVACVPPLPQLFNEQPKSDE